MSRLPSGEDDVVDLRLDVFPPLLRLSARRTVDLVVEVADVAHDRLVPSCRLHVRDASDVRARLTVAVD
jgi:hypothetical protein